MQYSFDDVFKHIPDVHVDNSREKFMMFMMLGDGEPDGTVIHPGLSLKELAILFQSTPRTTRKYLNSLLAKGLVEQIEGDETLYRLHVANLMQTDEGGKDARAI